MRINENQIMKLQPVNYQQARPASGTQTTAPGAPRRRGPALSQASRQSQLEQTHGRELREFDAFQQHIRQLMQNRHKQEELSLQAESHTDRTVVLARQQTRERDELQAAQLLSLQLLKEKQAQEKTDLLGAYR
ncbi:hypothetical protein [Spirosoma rigui]|uniref:hypothetical protein n=1 Tax=Spirosoma rigui TaxID=564064 RepID=UPI0009B0414D|nr:hypothetical protein [Spirosoma rigui]